MKAIEFGIYLRELRKNKKLTIRQVELYSGVSNAYLSQIENGKRGIPSPDILKKLSECLEVPYEQLMKKAGYLDKEDEFTQEEEMFISDVNKMSLEQLLEKYDFGMDLTEEEIREAIAFIKFKKSQK